MSMPFTAFGNTFSLGNYTNLDQVFAKAFNLSYAVQLFFVLSGFIFMYVYFEKISENRVSFPTYAVARVARLYPVATITTIVCALLWRIVNGGWSSLFRTITSLGLIAGFNGGVFASDPYNSPLWTLAVEIWAYLVFYCVVRYSKNAIRNIVLIAAIGSYITSLNITTRELYIFSANSFRVFPGFFMGSITYLIWVQIRRSKYRKTIGYILLATFLFCFVCQVKVGVNFLDSSSALRFLALSWFVFPILLISILEVGSLNRFLSRKFFAWLGDLSYSIYLWHYPIFLLLHLLYSKGILIPLQNKWVMLASVLLVLLVAHVSYHMLEKPMQNYIREKYKAYAIKSDVKKNNNAKNVCTQKVERI
jgi:peptidoglycan/LPS O-acetylase OafA/YrhL